MHTARYQVQSWVAAGAWLPQPPGSCIWEIVFSVTDSQHTPNFSRHLFRSVAQQRSSFGRHRSRQGRQPCTRRASPCPARPGPTDSSRCPPRDSATHTAEAFGKQSPSSPHPLVTGTPE